MKQFEKYKDVDFANDDQFIDWVINPDNKKDIYWQRVKKAYPYLVKEINLARKIVWGLYPHEEQIQKETIDNIWLKVQKGKKKKNNYLLYAAAVVFISLLVGGGVIFQNYQKNNSYLAFDENLDDQSKLYSNSQSPIFFEDATIALDYSNTSGVILNKDSVLKFDQGDTKERPNQMEKIVVPYGKRLCLTLSDKTQVWINSGSQLVFPKRFKSAKREVYLVGEAFFKVVHNQKQSFIVHTANSSVKVLGTEFNVKAYSEDSREETVLVSGEVSLSNNKLWDNATVLHPGQMSVLSKKDNSIVLKEVDINQYTSWINGYIVFKKETASEVLIQLSRHYNKKIVFNKDAGHITFSGKLDLSEDLDVVLTRLCKTSSMRYFYEDEKIIVKL